MKETDIVRAILKYLKTLDGCFAWKEHGGMYGTAGIPDIIACIGGRFYAFEVKLPKGKTTKLQDATICKILKAGGTAVVVRSVSEVRAVFENAVPCNDTKTTNL
ncbi:MAG: VRR-NUC domain-containing protein [Firmicutes bacterium]|nr:VRR-NUC domain-containing protein [Bacillota bacterium]